jgi:gamma-glutamylcyclotransferase
MLYFSYGSNLSIKRLGDRVPSAKFVAVATLQKHVLKFHKVSKDGSGKCDIFETGKSEDTVIGAVFDIDEAEKPELDRKEGLHYGYEEKSVVVTTVEEGELLNATTYYATNINPSLKPYHWYKEHVIRGAMENGLPDHYVKGIETVDSVPDPKPERHEIEMAIYS